MDRLTFLHLLSTVRGAGMEAPDNEPPVPIREHGTGIPFLPGSILAESLRSICTEQESGEAPAEMSEAAAPADTGLQLSDHSLLLLPVRSYRGTFVWATSPLILHRFVRNAGEVATAPPAVPQPGFEEDALVGHVALRTIAEGGKAVLEELDLDARGDAAASEWSGWLGERLFPGRDGESAFWRSAFTARLCIVHDGVIPYLTARALALSRERPDGTIDGLPAETVLQGTAAGTSLALAALEAAAGRPVSVGGGVARLVIGGVRP